jgi:hypothetical protein
VSIMNYMNYKLKTHQLFYLLIGKLGHLGDQYSLLYEALVTNHETSGLSPPFLVRTRFCLAFCSSLSHLLLFFSVRLVCWFLGYRGYIAAVTRRTATLGHIRVSQSWRPPVARVRVCAVNRLIVLKIAPANKVM